MAKRASANPYAKKDPTQRDTSKDVSFSDYFKNPQNYKGWIADKATRTVYAPSAVSSASKAPTATANATTATTPAVPPTLDQQRATFDQKMQEIQTAQTNYQSEYAKQLAAMQNSYTQQLGLLSSQAQPQAQTQQDLLATYQAQLARQKQETEGLLGNLNNRFQQQLSDRDGITQQLQQQYQQSLADIQAQRTNYESLLSAQSEQSAFQKAQAEKAMAEYESRNAQNVTKRNGSLLKRAVAAQGSRSRQNITATPQTSNSSLTSLLRR